MFKLLFLLILPLLMSVAVMAQTASLSGKIVDSADRKPLAYATVTVRQGEEIVNFKLSTADGSFKVPLLPVGKKLQATISFVGYRTVIKNIELGDKGLDMGTVAMAAGKELQEVVITAQRPPIVVKKDTVEFNADAFKTMPNALVEDLFKKLPGFKIDKDGKLTVNGKPVERLLVDSREFFGGETGTAMKNLDAATIDKVQVTENVDELKYGAQNIADKGKKVTINLTLKKWAKRGALGKAGIGAGTHKTYDASVIGNVFRDTLQLSLIAFTNNRNKGSFSFRDLAGLGGFTRAGVRGLTMNENGGVAVNGIGFGGLGEGLNKETGTGFNWNDISKGGLESNLQYFYGRIHNNTELYRNTLQQLGSGTQVKDYGSSAAGLAEKHNAAASFYIKPGKDKRSSLSVKPAFTANAGDSDNASYTAVQDGQGKHITGVGANVHNSNRANSFTNAAVYTYRPGNKKTTLVLSNDLAVHSNKVKGSGSYTDTTYTTNNNAAAAFTKALADNSNGSEISSTAKVTYRGTKWQYGAALQADVEHMHRAVSNSSNTGTAAANGHGELTRRLYSYTLLPELTYVAGKNLTVTLMPNVAAFNSTAEYSNYHAVKQRAARFLPGLSLRILNDLNINYGEGVSSPESEKILAVDNTFNPLVTVQGNPDLMYTENKTLGLSYEKYFTKPAISTFVFSQYDYNKNPVITAYQNNDDGTQVLRPVNINSSWRWSGNADVRKELKLSKDWSLIGSAGFYSGMGGSQVIINGRQTGIRTNNFSQWYSTTLQYSTLMELSFVYMPTKNYTLYDDYFADLITRERTLNTELKFNFNGVILFRNKFSLQNYNQGVTGIQRLYMWNMAVDYMFLKNKRGMLSLSGNDLLNQAKTYTTRVTPGTKEITRTNILPRYFFLSFSYNLKGFTGPKKATARWDLF